MSPDRQPWWYSGDNEGEPVEPSGEHVEPSGEPTAETSSDDSAAAAVDWGLLLAGAARIVDWATSTVMAPHAEHANPAEHPQCVVCRGIVLVQSQQPAPEPGPGPAPDDAAMRSSEITWIPISDADPGA